MFQSCKNLAFYAIVLYTFQIIQEYPVDKPGIAVDLILIPEGHQN